MEYKNLLVELENGILTITLNRPKQLNALNIETFNEINRVLKFADETNEVKAILFTGSGEKAFIAGADIKEFSNFSVKQAKQLSKNGHRTFRKIEKFKKPILAAVNGFALGGGLELAMACHFRIASDNAKFGQPEVNLGLIPGYAGTQRLPMLIGKGNAMELLMTGDMIDAQRAKELGLVNSVTTQEELIPTAKKILKKIMSKSPLAINGIIKTVNAFYNKNKNGFKTEVDVFGESFGTDDFKEGVSAFMEKRKPEFKGK
ncbi:MAG: enoyl-CoA hydratase-related protein [Bacteroidales bacterium]|nr:enoyl-CoA hydratase-related protein [Bacteroidales bacterium]